MTALAGFWNQSGRPDAGAFCERMLTAQHIYGPHGKTVLDLGDVAIGRSLFETLPEDRFDRGAVESASRRYALVGDVRLDDRDALGDALNLPREVAGKLPDAAFLLLAWEKWGEGCFDRLYGDYAFALWDRAERRLVLARDPLGGRPLHYHRGKEVLAFASMPKGLHVLPGIPKAPNETHVAEFLALLPELGPETFFESIDRVEPGHFVVFAVGTQASRRHWRPERRTIEPWRGDAVEGLRAHLDGAVSARLRGCDGKVGAHLSAGLDSSAVATTAARLLAGQGEVFAFTAVPRADYGGYVPPGRIGDEGPLAAATAARFANMRHRLVRIDDGSMIEEWERDFDLLERPLYNSVNQRWANAISAAACEEGVGVILTGSTGNSTISYSGMELFPELLRSGELRLLVREMRALVGGGHARWRGALASAFVPWLPAPVLALLHRLRGRPVPGMQSYSVINPDRIDALELQRRVRGRGTDMSWRERTDGFEARLWHLLRFDTGNYQKAGLGGWGVDIRDPTADRRLIEFCFSLPTRLFFADGEPRALGKRALADRLPAAVIEEKRRGFQAADWREALTAANVEIRSEIDRLRDVPTAVAALDLARMEKLIDELASGGVGEADDGTQYRLALMRGLAVGLFLRKAATG